MRVEQLHTRTVEATVYASLIQTSMGQMRKREKCFWRISDYVARNMNGDAPCPSLRHLNFHLEVAPRKAQCFAF
jgi:hypothetical protein